MASWRPAEWMKFLLKNGSLIVAINALLISVMSLWLTIESARLDREYKEVSIVPNIGATIDPSAMLISIESNGLGPARLKRLFALSKDRCVDSELVPISVWLDELQRVMFEWTLELIDAAFPKEMQKFIEESITFQIQGAAPKVILRPGDKITLFQIVNPSVFEDRLKDMNTKSGWPIYRETYSKFIATAHARLPIAVEYCSMTGRSCFTSTNFPKEGCAK